MKRFKGILFIFLSAVFWGTAGLFVSALRDTYGIKEMQIIIGRGLFTIILLGLFMLFYDRSLFKIKLKDLWVFAVIGVASITFFNYCYYNTMALINLSVAAVLMYTAPIFVMIISIIFFKEKFTFAKSLCCILAITGVALVSGIIGNSGNINLKGLIFGLLTGFGYSLYGIFSSILIKKGYSPYTINFYAFIFVFAASLIILTKDLPKTFSLYTVSYKPIVIILLMALINTVIPYIAYSSGLKTVSPTVAIIIATFEPVVAMIIDIIMGHTPDVFGYIGIAVILFAVLLLNISEEKVKKNDSKIECEDKLNA
ncbi:MAG: DMT family transporter [Clostridia bacterium]|nr:DMT family transporter [Clostridia bacterium]